MVRGCFPNIHGSIFEVGLGISLLGMDEDGEFGRVAKKEDGRIVEDPIPITFFGVEFEGKASRISR